MRGRREMSLAPDPAGGRVKLISHFAEATRGRHTISAGFGPLRVCVSVFPEWLNASLHVFQRVFSRSVMEEQRYNSISNTSVCLQDKETCPVLAESVFMCTRVCVSEELVFRRKVLRSHEAQDKHLVCVWHLIPLTCTQHVKPSWLLWSLYRL